MDRLKLTKNIDLLLYLVISCVWVKKTILAYFNRVWSENISSICRTVEWTIILLCVAVLVIGYLRKINIAACVVFLFVIISFIGSWLLGDAKVYIRKEFFFFAFEVFPFFFIGLVFPGGNLQREKLIDLLTKLSIASIVLGFLYIFFYMATGRDWSGVDKMDFAYANLPHVLLAIWIMFKSNKLIYIPVSVMGVCITMICGTRGALLTIVLWTLYCFLGVEKDQKRKIVLLGGGVTGILVLILFWKEVVVALRYIFFQLGFNTRIFDFILESSIAASNGRTPIYTAIMTTIKDSNGKAFGLYYDRVLLKGTYSHNLFLELLLDYGIYVGALLILILTVAIIRKYRNIRNKDFKDFFVMMCCMIFVQLMLSNSYLRQPWFFFLVGILCMKESTAYENESIINKSIL